MLANNQFELMSLTIDMQVGIGLSCCWYRPKLFECQVGIFNAEHLVLQNYYLIT